MAATGPALAIGAYTYMYACWLLYAEEGRGGSLPSFSYENEPVEN